MFQSQLDLVENKLDVLKTNIFLLYDIFVDEAQKAQNRLKKCLRSSKDQQIPEILKHKMECFQLSLTSMGLMPYARNQSIFLVQCNFQP